MAATYYLTGFESGQKLAAGFATINDGSGYLSLAASPRSGDYAFKSNKTAAAANVNVQVAALGHNATTPNTEAGNRARCFLKLLAAPSGDDEVLGWAGNATDNTVRLIITASRTFKLRVGSTTSAASTFVIPLDTWVEVDISVFLHNDSSASAADDYTKGSVTIGGETITVTKGSISNFAIGALFFGSLQTTQTSHYLIDDYVVVGDSQTGPGACVPAGSCGGARSISQIPTLVLPEEDEILPVSPAGPGAQNDWTNDWQALDERPFDTTSGASEQTSASVNAVTLVAHAGAVSSVQGVHVLAMLKRSAGSAGQALLFNGGQYAVTEPTTYISPTTPNVTVFGALTAAEFAAAPFGVKNLTGATLQLGALLLEVLGVSNLPPTVDAGPDQILEDQQTTTLTGTADDDGQLAPLVTTWSQVSGPATATIDDPAALTTLVHVPQGGVYVFRLTADDGEFQISDDLRMDVDLGFTDAEGLAGTTIGLSHVQYQDGDGTAHVASHIAQADPAGYYHGFKPATVLSYQSITRGLSDDEGQMEGAVAGWTLADTGRQVRTLLAGARTRFLRGQLAVIRAVADAARRLQGIQRVLFRGVLQEVQATAGFQATFRAIDTFTDRYGAQSVVRLPRRAVTREDYPEAPDASVGLPVPWLYGRLSDRSEAGTDDPDLLEAAQQPVTGVTVTRTAQPVAAPTSVTATAIAGGDTPPGRRAYYHLTRVVGGTEGEPSALVTADTTDTDGQIRLTWDPTTADAIWIYRSHRDDFWQMEVMELAGSATEFVDNPVLAPDAWPIAERLNLTVYVYALLAPGVFSQPGEARLIVAPGGGIAPFATHLNAPRFAVAWDAFPDATGYRVIVHRSWYSNWRPGYHYQFDVPATQTALDFVFNGDDAHDPIEVPGQPIARTAPAGVVPVVPVGHEVIGGTPYTILLVAGHACAGARPITDIFVRTARVPDDTVGTTEPMYERVPDADLSTRWLIPGGPGWPFPDTFRDRNGRRYTELYTTVDPLPEAIGVTVNGRETVGDGTGTLLTDLWDQWLDLLRHQVLGVYDAGASLPTPVFEAEPVTPAPPARPQIDEDSFAAAQARQPVTAAWGLGLGRAGFVSVPEALADLARSAGAWYSPANRHLQFMVAILDPPALLAAPITHDGLRDIVEGSFSVEERIDQHWNVVPYSFRRIYLTGEMEGVDEVRDQASIDGYGGVERVAPLQVYGALREAAAARARATAFLRRHRDPPRLVRYRTGLQGTALELGDPVRVTHPEGLGAEGYVRQPLRVHRHHLDPLDYGVTIEAVDEGRMLRSLFILGPAGIADRWAEADDSDRFYGYLASTDDFADGESAKRLG